MFYDESGFVITVVSIFFGCIIMSIKLVFNLKCRELKCCGICSLIRAVELETFDIIPSNSPNNIV